MLRILAGVFAVVYLLVRLPVFLQLGDRRTGFDGVGPGECCSTAGSTPPSSTSSWAQRWSSGSASSLGWRFRVSGTLFASGMLALGSYRGSWGQLLHFENLMVLYLLIVALSPAADAWSLDARRRGRGDVAPRPSRWRTGGRSRWLALVLVITYVITGVAKLRYGGLEWVAGRHAAQPRRLRCGSPRPARRVAVAARRVGRAPGRTSGHSSLQ